MALMNGSRGRSADPGDGFKRRSKVCSWLAICVLPLVASPNCGQPGRFSAMASRGDRVEARAS